MSFPPNNNYQQGPGAYFSSSNANNNPQDQKTGSWNASENNWFIQQNWQPQNEQSLPQQYQPIIQTTNFFDNIPNVAAATSSSQPTVPTLAANTSAEGWGDWDDWNQNEAKHISTPGNQLTTNNYIQNEPIKNVVTESFQSNDNWQWQNNPIIANPTQPLTETKVNSSEIPTPNSFLMKSTPITTILPENRLPPQTKSNQSDEGTFRRQGLNNKSGGNIFSNSLAPSTSLLVPSLPVNVNENQVSGVPENLEIFDNNGPQQITLPNVQTIEEQTTYIAPVPQMFQNPSIHAKETAVQPSFTSIRSTLQNQHIPDTNVYSSAPNHHQFGNNVHHGKLDDQIIVAAANVQPISADVQPSIETAQQEAQFVLPSSNSSVIQSMDERERFLNQENLSDERNRFLTQTERAENLLPPPIAYQQSQPTANDDRNQYLQTSHLSEDDFVVLNNPSNDDDVNLPPPGLSRFVLGEPENTGDIERHADGEDDDSIQPPPPGISAESSRNMYSFTSPIDIQVQRVVTGVESISISQPPVVALTEQVESREIDLDGENIEDQHQSVVKSVREEPTIGGDPSSNEPEVDIAKSANVVVSKELTNSSTGNESDHQHYRNDNKKYSTRSGKNKKRYESDDSEVSSHHERQRHKEKDRKGKSSVRDSDDEESYRQKGFKKREEKSRHVNRYDDSRYETEESTRYEKSGKQHGRKDRDRKYDEDLKRGGSNRRSYRTGERNERRGDRENRERSDREKNYADDRRRRGEQKYRNIDDGYQNYSRKTNNSRNARDSDYEKDPRYNRRYNNMYGGYDYDPYAYYHQHQQYFEQLRRTNPQSYAEWYRKYYSQMQGDAMSGADCRGSVHSGRSSAAGHDKDRPENMSNVEGRSVVQDSIQGEEELQTGRITPYKFSNDHAVLSLVSGVLVSVKPKYSHSNGLQNIVKLIKVAPNDSTKKLFQSFPGPLVKGITHKKTVIEYCEDRIKLGPISSNRLRSYQSSSNSLQSLGSQQSNQSSYVLLWNLLILLLRQNGVVVGTDIAELLVKNQKLFPYESPSKRNSINSIEKELKGSNESNTSDIEEGEINENTPISGESSDEKSKMTDEEITDKFRNYLLYGNVKEALEWATDNNLWGHALFLASKVDKRLHANVMMKFANKLQLNDPLQTLYQLMSGRCPSSVTSVQDEKWGDWRPHLAMIISNTTQSPELNRKAITSLGDSLLNRGDLFAGQFCYLMAQVGFGKYSLDGDSQTSTNMNRLVLLGSSHIKSNSFLEFATNEAIIMTEIYEYACSLNDEAFSIIEFQPYKFLFSCRLLDYGFHLKALMYLEQISVHIQKNTSRYEVSFIEKVYELADKLKFYDPVMEKTFSDMSEGQFEDQEWLKDLKYLLESNQLSTESQIPYESSNYNQEQIHQPTYEFNNYQPTLPIIADTEVVNQIKDFQQPESDIHYQPDQQYTATNNEIPEETYENYYQQHEIKSDNAQPTSLQSSSQVLQQPHFNNQEFYQKQQSQPSFTGGAYDYYNQNISSQQPVDPTSTPSISMPNSGHESKRSIFDEDDHGSGSNPKNEKHQDIKKDENKKISQQQKQGQPLSQNSGWFGGIWNKFSGKPKNQMILPDDKNPTIVWDAEKKKWINTDEGEDSQESFVPPPKMSEFNSSFQNQDIHQQHQQQEQQQPQQLQQQAIQQPQLSHSQSATMPVSGITDPMAPIQVGDTQVQTNVKTSGLQSNMFKMQRNRTLKKSYVDVFNPSGATTKTSESIMAPSLPPLPQSGFMVPGVPSQNQQQAASQFYDPNSYSGNFQ